jgi:hypothetical protein
MAGRPTFVDTPMPSPITEFTCIITSTINGTTNHFASGTAVIIGANLALSARHVFEDHLAHHEGRPLPMGEAAAHFRL